MTVHNNIRNWDTAIDFLKRLPTVHESQKTVVIKRHPLTVQVFVFAACVFFIWTILLFTQEYSAAITIQAGMVSGVCLLISMYLNSRSVIVAPAQIEVRSAFRSSVHNYASIRSVDWRIVGRYNQFGIVGISIVFADETYFDADLSQRTAEGIAAILERVRLCGLSTSTWLLIRR